MPGEFPNKTPLGRVKGLGPSHEGTRHWWLQRATAVVLVPLVIWTVYSILSVAGAERHTVVMWFGHPVSALALAVTIFVGLYHAFLGLETVITDYVHKDWVRVILLWALRFFALVFTGMGTLSLLVMVYHRFIWMN